MEPRAPLVSKIPDRVNTALVVAMAAAGWVFLSEIPYWGETSLAAPITLLALAIGAVAVAGWWDARAHRELTEYWIRSLQASIDLHRQRHPREVEGGEDE